ncbi:MAG: glycoside hydrolase family 97 catalytic domain-containing protein [Bacteroidales bacterium]
MEFTSPEGAILLRIETSPKIQWSVFHKGQEIIATSPVSMTLQNGEVLGENARIARQKTEKINTSFNAINYRKAVVQDVCTQATLSFHGDYGIIFRVYDDAVAYRFFTNRPGDISWIKPGQVAWDWWSNMNISHVDFRAGMNTPSYKYYIDFASLYGIPYILLDGGWNVPGDLTKARPEIDLDELVAYGKLKGVGIIVWCSWKDVLARKDKAFPYYEKTGIKGMKIDFVDRDDQVAVASTYEIARQAAGHKLMVDYHGVFEVPVQMLADNPTAYLREPECTSFITKIPTTFDETVPLDGKVAEYVAIARRKADTWFVGAMTSWTPRELTIDFSFLPEGNYRAEIFSDGINADRDATDYTTEVITIRKGDTLKIKMMSGGGWAARLEKTD